MRLCSLVACAVLVLCGAAFGQVPAASSQREAKKAAVAGAESSGPGPIVEERIIPGTEPQSPSTLGLAVGDAGTVRRTSSATGSMGVLHVHSADLGRKGVLRFSGVGEYFNSGDFPVRGASDTRSAGTFALSYVPFDWLELYASYSASANSNSTSSPRHISSLGDFGAGAKVAGRLGSAFYAGLELSGMAYASPGNQQLRGSAAGLASQLIATYDLREATGGFPLRLHGNLGAAIDNTRNVLTTDALNAAEQYALSVNRYHRLAFGVAAEVPFPVLTPFVEYNLRVPLRVPGGVLVGPDGVPIALGRVLPQTVSVGAKVTAIRDLTLTAAVDLGLTRLVGLGVPATPPYNIVFGAAFNVDLFSRGETRIVEKTNPPAPPAVAPEPSKPRRVAGAVLDARTKKPIAGAVVSLVGSGIPPVATDVQSGTFVTHDLTSGRVRIAVHKEGYRPAERDLLVPEGQTSVVEFQLDPFIKKAHFAVSVTSKQHPIAANVSLKGAEEIVVPISGAYIETAKTEAPPGHYVVEVTAPGYLSQARSVQATEGAEMVLSFDLLPKPKRSLVRVAQNKIEMVRQIHFAAGKATILADSFALLTQVVDAIVSEGIKRIRIEGHTDNRGNPKVNLRLSEQRARAVARYLEQAGIDRERLEPAGFGDRRPVAPNLTARGRELNRRVELVIVDR